MAWGNGNILDAITVYRDQPTCQRAIPTSPVLFSIERRIPINTDTLPEMPDDSAAPTGLFTDDQQVARCVWCRATPAYQHYHDHEWAPQLATVRQVPGALESVAVQLPTSASKPSK